MLSYPIEEAEELLDTKLTAAKTSLSNCEEDMDFLREQITVSVMLSPSLSPYSPPFAIGWMLTTWCQKKDHGGRAGTCV